MVDRPGRILVGFGNRGFHGRRGFFKVFLVIRDAFEFGDAVVRSLQFFRDVTKCSGQGYRQDNMGSKQD